MKTKDEQEKIAWLLDNRQRSRKPDVYNSTDYPKIALLAPRIHAGQTYNEREVIFTNNSAYVAVKRGEGWEAMLKHHYDERVTLDKGWLSSGVLCSILTDVLSLRKLRPSMKARAASLDIFLMLFYLS